MNYIYVQFCEVRYVRRRQGVSIPDPFTPGKIIGIGKIPEEKFGTRTDVVRMCHRINQGTDLAINMIHIPITKAEFDMIKEFDLFPELAFIKYEFQRESVATIWVNYFFAYPNCAII